MNKLKVLGWILVALSQGISWAANPDALAQAVMAYRQGHYSRAYDLLNQFGWQNQPRSDQPRWLYYQAISAVQVGEPQQADQLYRRLIEQFPGTEESRLAEQGLSQLATLSDARLDAPPGLNVGGTTGSQTANAALSPEQLQFNQLMGMLGGNPSANTLAAPSLESMLLQSQLSPNGAYPNGAYKGAFSGPNGLGLTSPGTPGSAAADPNVLSNLMMNQWLGQLDFTGNNRDRD